MFRPISKFVSYTLLGIIFISIGCQKSPSSYKTTIQNCLSGSTHISFTTDDGKNGFSHTVPTSCIIGAPLPDFRASDMHGNKITSKSLKGKINILNFWFTTCAPCIAEIPGLNQVKEKYGEDEINYISICRDSENDVREFLSKYPLTFDLIADGRTLTEQTFHSMWGYPLNIITNKENIIIAAFAGGPTDDSAPQVVFDKMSSILDSEALTLK